jgi:hypothetical protein
MKPHLTSSKIRVLVLCVGLALAAAAIGACGGKKAPESAFYEFLRFVPDRPAYRQYLTFGDAAAWHASWGVPRIDNLEQFEALDREPRAYWLYIMFRQTTPPEYLSVYLAEDPRSFYGFDLFNLDRYLLAGRPPDWITVAGFSFDVKQIADALAGSGYQAEKLKTGGTLYSIRGDYQYDLSSPTKTGRMGDLNRIGLLDDKMVTSKATEPVTASLAAYNDQIPSLADDPEYVALAQALDDPALAGTGQLMGAIVEDGLEISLDDYAVSSLGSGATAQQVEEKLAELRQSPQIPAYSLVAFVTCHTEGATYLILAVVFPKGTDGQTAADLLADRLRNYVSASYKRPLSEVWAERGATLEKAAAVEAGGLPVALVLVRAEDPAPTPPDQEQVNAYVVPWVDLVSRRDVGFLWR